MNTIREALTAAGCTSPDGTFVHASMNDVIAVITALAATPTPYMPVIGPCDRSDCEFPKCDCYGPGTSVSRLHHDEKQT